MLRLHKYKMLGIASRALWAPRRVQNVRRAVEMPNMLDNCADAETCEVGLRDPCMCRLTFLELCNSYMVCQPYVHLGDMVSANSRCSLRRHRKPLNP